MQVIAGPRGSLWDGYGLYRAGGRLYGFLLEYDRGTMRARDYRRKFAAYYRYRDTGRFQRDYTGFPTILVVTSGTGCQRSFGSEQGRSPNLNTGGHEICTLAASKAAHLLKSVAVGPPLLRVGWTSSSVAGEWGHVGNSAGVVQAWREPGGMSPPARHAAWEAVRCSLSGNTPLPAVACANLTLSPDVMHTCA